MRKIIVCMALLLAGVVGLSQTEKENGIIYINHPYIDIVNNSMKAYLEKDIATNTKIFADTAKISEILFSGIAQ